MQARENRDKMGFRVLPWEPALFEDKTEGEHVGKARMHKGRDNFKLPQTSVAGTSSCKHTYSCKLESWKEDICA